MGAEVAHRRGAWMQRAMRACPALALAIFAACSHSDTENDERIRSVDLLSGLAHGSATSGAVVSPEHPLSWEGVLPERARLVVAARGTEARELEVEIASESAAAPALHELAFGPRAPSQELDLAPYAGRSTKLVLRAREPTSLERAGIQGRLAHPHLVLIVIDTLRADFGRALAGTVATPNLDRLASEGIEFAHAFSHAPMTLPSHTSLMSSRLPGETLVVNNGERVPPALPLLPAHLSAQGYATHAVVSLGTLCASRAPATSVWPGFDAFTTGGPGFSSNGAEVNLQLVESLEGLGGWRPFFLFAHYSDPHEPYDAHFAEPKVAELDLDGERAWSVTTSDASHAVLERTIPPGRHRFEIRSDDPFVLRKLDWKAGGAALSCTPVEPRPKGATRKYAFDLDVPGDVADACTLEIYISDEVRPEDVPLRYAREVEFADREVGRLLELLRARGLYDDSLIVLTSDHGESLGERERIGHTQTLFDEAIHVPLIVKLPKGSHAAPALRESARGLVSHIDLVPTVLELLELPPLPGQRGRSWLDLHPAAPVLSETHQPEAKHDLVSLRDERFKLVFVVDEERFELYDLAQDPAEKHDVFAERGAERAGWQARLREHAEAFKRARQPAEEMDESTADALRALGYLGGGEASHEPAPVKDGGGNRRD